MEFRAGGQIGANALALPGGILVFTDEIVALAQHDDELVAVAAHELGHVRHRHVLRQILASTGVLVVGQVVLGDVSGILDLAGGLPAILLQSGYSRDMESEADAHALAMLERACLPPRRFSDLLGRLDAAHGGELKAITLFSSHPDTRERLRNFQERELVTRGC
jgi:Zn-dependent protease with chaperone function